MKTLKYTIIALIALISTSCLEMGLEELESYSDAEITNFNFEHRYMGMNGENERLVVLELKTTTTLDSLTSTIMCDITVPDTSANLSVEERAKILQSSIVGYADISLAASLKPIGDSPKLGVISDFTASDMKYKVTAGDGDTSKEWTLVINSFTK